MNISRRQFLRLRPADMLRESRRPEREERPLPMRPPGTRRPDTAFVKTCIASEGCTACIDACPHDVIKALGPAWGAAEGTPFMDVDTNPCRWCQPMDCIEACEADALVMDASGAVPAVAKIALDLDECLNRQGTICSDCSDFCPSSVRAMSSVGREPKLDAESCVGCGLCVWYCDAPGDALTVLRLDAQVANWPRSCG